MSKRSNLSRTACPWFLMGVLLAASLAFAQDQTTRYPIAEAAIVESLNRIGVNVDPSRIHLPMKLTSKSPSPDLEVTSVESAGNNNLQLGFRCAKRGECLPFNAIVADVNSADLSVISRKWSEAALADSASGRATYGMPAGMKNRAPEQDKSSGAILKAGTRVRLVIWSGHMEIQIPALAMESGPVGKEVRLCSLDRKKSFRATVIDDKSAIGDAE